MGMPINIYCCASERRSHNNWRSYQEFAKIATQLLLNAVFMSNFYKILWFNETFKFLANVQKNIVHLTNLLNTVVSNITYDTETNKFFRIGENGYPIKEIERIFGSSLCKVQLVQ